MATTYLGSGFWFFGGFAHSRQRSARSRQKSAHRKKHGTQQTEI